MKAREHALAVLLRICNHWTKAALLRGWKSWRATHRKRQRTRVLLGKSLAHLSDRLVVSGSIRKAFNSWKSRTVELALINRAVKALAQRQLSACFFVCLRACLLACLLACLFACLLSCLLAFLLAFLLAYLLAFSLACLLAF